MDDSAVHRRRDVRRYVRGRGCRGCNARSCHLGRRRPGRRPPGRRHRRHGGRTDTAAVEPAADSAPLDPRERGVLRNFLGYEFPPAPDTPTGPIDQAAVDILEVIWAGLELGGFDGGLVAGLGNTGDARLAWIMSDLLRFFVFGDIHDGSISAFQKLTGVRVADDPVAERSSWQSVTDHLIAWDLPAFPRYAEYKGRLLTLVEPRWQPFFDDPEPAIDWRLVSWGGVYIDDRELGDPRGCPRGCIPALDDPAVTDAAGGSWYPDDGHVFAVTINGEARAYPRHMMESPRDGQRHPRRAPHRHALLHAVRLGPGLLHRRRARRRGPPPSCARRAYCHGPTR